MSKETKQLITLLQQQMQEMRREKELAEQRHKEEQELAEKRRKKELELAERRRMEEREEMRREREEMRRQHMEQMDAIMKLQDKARPTMQSAPSTTSSFSPFDPSTELWTDYWARFNTFVGANSIPEERKAQVFLTNQSTTTYKLLSNLAGQQTPPKDINELMIDDIMGFMKDQFDPKRFIVRERFKFWSDMQRKPGETVQELAARIRQDAATCDFASIKDSQDEALRTRFICSVNNEAVLKALFKIKDDELDFAKAVNIAIETEDAARVAKETVYGAKPKPVNKVKEHKSYTDGKQKPKEGSAKPKFKCYRCGKETHKPTDCRFKNATCNFCKKIGHIENACMIKAKSPNKKSVKAISQELVNEVVGNDDAIPKMEVHVEIEGHSHVFEIDTGTNGNFVTKEFWERIGKPKLQKPEWRYSSASKHEMPIMGTFIGATMLPGTKMKRDIKYIVSKVQGLNLLGRTASDKLGISLDKAREDAKQQINAVFDDLLPDKDLQDACRKLCNEFPDLWKNELGCLKDFELDVKFKPDAKPVFKKARPVPFAIQEDLAKAYDEGIKKGVWKPVQFCDYGTPVVPVRKAHTPGKEKPKLRVCGDYSVTVNPQLETHRHPMPLPEDLMRKLGGGYGFTKIDLADAYNQVQLSPESQRRLALSTHRGVLLQLRLPFGIKSAPGYFQEIMEQLTSDLHGVAVYMDDILVSGKDPEDHLRNLRRLLQRLNERGLRCRLEKCKFAQPQVEYLGHRLSKEGIAKGPKVDAVRNMPEPTDVSSLKSFLGSVQFYGKFLKNLSTEAEPLHRLTKKGVTWQWESEEKRAFQKLKDMLGSDDVLVHYDPTKKLGIACDASEIGIGAVLFHRYEDGSERPIANVSKTLNKAQRNYSQVQKEALAIVFGLKKFYQYVWGRKFTLVTDHKPLIALFGPTKETPALAANRLARWALLLNKFDYEIEYRKTTDHSNADALSRLPCGSDDDFDGEESEADIDMVCAIETLSLQVKPADAETLAKESAKDPVISNVMRYTREGWPQEQSADKDTEMGRFRKLKESLSTCNGCLLHGSRVVVPASLRPQVLDLLHLGHFGMQRMKQLARTAVYWPNIDQDIENTCRRCTTCAEHQNNPPKPAVHPWMLPEKPWSRLHLDHAINFLGSNWLVLIDSYSKYPCIHPTQAITAKATIDLLEGDFAHFGYPHTLVTDNATTFQSQEFKAWCKDHGIVHLTGAPYHPATNGAAERLVQTFKQAMRKSNLPPKKALNEFLIQYRRTPAGSGYSPSELLNGRQIRSKIDTLRPSPAHVAQGKQAKEATKSQIREVSKLTNVYTVGDPVYAKYYGPRRDREPRWVPAIVTKRLGSRSVNVKVFPRGPTWRRHVEQIRPRYASQEDSETGDEPQQEVQPQKPDPPETVPSTPAAPTEPQKPAKKCNNKEKKRNTGQEGPEGLRRSTRPRKPPQRYGNPVLRLEGKPSGSAGRCHGDRCTYALRDAKRKRTTTTSYERNT
jgi:transposase InsO family protein